MINTGAPRSITGHLVSGAVVSAILSGAINLKKVKEGSMESSEALKKTAKETAQGGIGLGAGIAIANMLGSPNTPWLRVATTAAVATAAVYAIEAVASHDLPMLTQGVRDEQ